MSARKNVKPGARWVSVYQVWHVRAGRYIRRHDGLPFVFPVNG